MPTAETRAASPGKAASTENKRRVAPTDILGTGGVKLATGTVATTIAKAPSRSAANRAAPKAERKKDEGAMPVMIKPVRSIGPRARS